MSENFLKECVKEVDMEETASAIQQSIFLTKDDIPKSYEKRLEELKKSQTRAWYSLTNTAGKRVATIILATLATLTISAFALYQTNAFGLRTWFDGWVSEMFERYSTSRSVDNPINKNKIEEVYTFADVPDGWELAAQDSNDYIATHIYNNGQSDIYLHQYAGDGVGVYDTEDAVVEVVKIKKIKGQYIQKNGTVTLLWWHDGYRFTVVSDALDKKQVINLAENIIPE